MGLPRRWREGVDERFRVGLHAQDRAVSACERIDSSSPWARYVKLLLYYVGSATFTCFCFDSEWRRPLHPVYTADYAEYIKILTWFFDSPDAHCPFSVHRMALAGKDMGTDVGQWFGPSIAAGSIKCVIKPRFQRLHPEFFLPASQETRRCFP